MEGGGGVLGELPVSCVQAWRDAVRGDAVSTDGVARRAPGAKTGEGVKGGEGVKESSTSGITSGQPGPGRER